MNIDITHIWNDDYFLSFCETFMFNREQKVH